MNRTRIAQHVMVATALVHAAVTRDWDLVTDALVYMRRAWGLPDDPPTRREVTDAVEHIRRTARAYKAGLDLPGCGDPECRDCVPEVIADPKLDALAKGDNGQAPPPPPPPELRPDRRFLDGLAPQDGERVYRFSNGAVIALSAAPNQPFYLIRAMPGVH